MKESAVMEDAAIEGAVLEGALSYSLYNLA